MQARQDAGEPSPAASLSESEARYRSALIAGRMGSWETDFVADTRTWSEEGMALFGLSLPGGRGQVGGDGDEYERALHPEDRHLAEAFRRRADHEDPLRRLRIVRPTARCSGSPGRGLVVARRPDGRRTGCQHHADVTSAIRERRTRGRRERLSLALEAGRMGAYDLDLRSDALWWSPQPTRFGVDPATFTPSRTTVIELVHPDDRAEFLHARGEAIARRRPLDIEMRIVRGDGSVGWIGHRGRTAYDDAGKPMRHFGIAMDISERKAAEAALRDADRKKDAFIATLAHELRNPSGRSGRRSLLRRSPFDDPQVAWCRDVIDRQVGQMAHRSRTCESRA